jgi:hypothetical protein
LQLAFVGGAAGLQEGVNIVGRLCDSDGPAHATQRFVDALLLVRERALLGPLDLDKSKPAIPNEYQVREARLAAVTLHHAAADGPVSRTAEEGTVGAVVNEYVGEHRPAHLEDGALHLALGWNDPPGHDYATPLFGDLSWA